MSHEKRLVNIESDLTHLEQLVASLNQTIIGHDKMIQQLQTQVNRAATGMETKEMDSIKGNVTKPPHYQCAQTKGRISSKFAVPVVPNW